MKLVLVPAEPTEEMVIAADEQAIEVLNDHSFALKEPTLGHRVYTAAIAAAPPLTAEMVDDLRQIAAELGIGQIHSNTMRAFLSHLGCKIEDRHREAQ